MPFAALPEKVQLTSAALFVAMKMPPLSELAVLPLNTQLIQVIEPDDVANQIAPPVLAELPLKIQLSRLGVDGLDGLKSAPPLPLAEFALKVQLVMVGDELSL